MLMHKSSDPTLLHRMCKGKIIISRFRNKKNERFIILNSILYNYLNFLLLYNYINNRVQIYEFFPFFQRKINFFNMFLLKKIKQNRKKSQRKFNLVTISG